MANSEKMTQRELKQPDAFQRVGAEARDWLAARQMIVVVGLGVLLVGGLLVALFSYISHRSEARAAKELGAALEILDRPVVPAPAGEQAPPATGDNKTFATTQAQDQALVDALKPIRDTHEGTPSATMAALPLGKAQYRLGKMDEALAAFSEYLKDAPQNDPMRTSALEGQGYAYEAQQKYDQALASFDEMSKVDAGGYLEGMGQYHRARILILQGKKEDAAAILVKLPVDHPGSAAARMATERTSLLASEGVKIPPPPEPAATPKDGGA